MALAQDSVHLPASSETFPSRASSAAAAKAAFNASALAALLRQSSLELKDFEWSEKERPLVAHNQFEHDAHLPVIDMSPLTTNASCSSDAQKRACAADMARAAREWGFFQVINHGVPARVAQNMEAQARAFFKLPLNQKRKVLREASGKPMGYAYAGVGTRLTCDFPWIESLQMPAVASEMERYAWKIWQHGNQDFRKAAGEFGDGLRGLSLRIMDALIQQLGCGSNGKASLLQGEVMATGGWGEATRSNSVVRLNCYPPCPQPSLTLGLGAHSDPHLLTVLHQDEVGGLQILKDNQWIALKPKPHSLVINIGDAFQVWSNDVYKSVEHRAVCNSSRSRLSMAFFLNPPDDATISPQCPPDCPPLYQPFTWGEYRECMYSGRPRGKSNLDHFRTRSFG